MTALNEVFVMPELGDVLSQASEIGLIIHGDSQEGFELSQDLIHKAWDSWKVLKFIQTGVCP